MLGNGNLISLTRFAIGTQAGERARHFDSSFAGTKILTMTPDEFLAVVNNEALERPLVDSENPNMPFCKHLFIPISAFGGRLDGVKAGLAEITDENRSLLDSGYDKRRDFELETLSRWFDSSDVTPADAAWIDVILYMDKALAQESARLREKALKEGTPVPTPDIVDTDFGIVSINAGVAPHEDPMVPATVVRNALGKEFGGNGAPVDREYYEKSVAFHKKWAPVK